MDLRTSRSNACLRCGVTAADNSAPTSQLDRQMLRPATGQKGHHNVSTGKLAMQLSAPMCWSM